ncbi:MAG: deoxyribodipyrimidine photo-lyase [Phycisphaerae bacterium]|nr:deoxyribodipyrimidine photo-lyase [Phycisphaerae bacterium]
MASIVWFRQDLRLHDNPAIDAAVRQGGPVVPVYVCAPAAEGGWVTGAAGRWWLHHSLTALAKDLERLGSRLIVRRGEPIAELLAVARSSGAVAAFWNRCYEPSAVRCDAAVEDALLRGGLRVQNFNGNLLTDPAEVLTQQGGPYRVYTPFWRACGQTLDPGSPLPVPRTLPAPSRWPASQSLDSLRLLPEPDWTSGMRAAWVPGREGASQQLEDFLESALARYDEDHNRPDRRGSSRLSAHLHFGEISPREVWVAVRERMGRRGFAGAKSAEAYLKEIFWREFAYHLLHHFPHTATAPLRNEFRSFPWRSDTRSLKAWQRGETGFPIVDAGMRELWTTGWMHNRVRMVVASFLVKDLLISWQDGARWFWDTLVDADLANNTLGWQWTGGCGADAAPYFRVFNPVSQGERFDPDGEYVRRWVPELGKLPAEWIHKPWEAPVAVLRKADVRIGQTYPGPIVDHGQARARALAAYASIRRR